MTAVDETERVVGREVGALVTLRESDCTRQQQDAEGYD